MATTTTGNHVTRRVHAAGQPVLGLDGALLRPGRARDHDLGDYADDAAAVTSELVTNASRTPPRRRSALELTCLEGSRAVAIVVTDPCSRPPVKLDPGKDAEHGRGLHIVEALSARWGWPPQDPGKAVYAILTQNA